MLVETLKSSCSPETSVIRNISRLKVERRCAFTFDAPVELLTSSSSIKWWEPSLCCFFTSTLQINDSDLNTMWLLKENTDYTFTVQVNSSESSTLYYKLHSMELSHFCCLMVTAGRQNQFIDLKCKQKPVTMWRCWTEQNKCDFSCLTGSGAKLFLSSIKWMMLAQQ